MRASLDTNVLIHLYRAKRQNMLFDFFKDGVFIYEQIRKIELENHGQDVLSEIDADIQLGRIRIYTDADLKTAGVNRIFLEHVGENRQLYSPGDLGEVYAISLAQTMGAYSLVTDDVKQGGPYMSLLQFEDEIKPFNFADIIILRFLSCDLSAEEAVEEFDSINEASHLKWNYKTQLAKFIQRFWKDPYQEEEKQWMQDYCNRYGVNFVGKIKELREVL